MEKASSSTIRDSSFPGCKDDAEKDRVGLYVEEKPDGGITRRRRNRAHEKRHDQVHPDALQRLPDRVV